MSYINREFFEIAEVTRRRETAVTLETHSSKKALRRGPTFSNNLKSHLRDTRDNVNPL